MKVLIIDDSPQALKIAQARLAKENLDILCAPNGKKGLKMARSSRPDLILLDIDMPEMSGFEICRMLKADEELCIIPVIFLTASDDQENKVKGLDMGAVDYVTKPFDAFELRARVRAALRTKHLQDLLIKYAQVDPLTELWNRRALMERLAREWSRVQRHGGKFSLIMADLDDFKHINDNYGHAVGDTLLQEVARAVRGECRKIDFPARYGGEEFTVLVPQQSQDSAANLAERCRNQIEKIDIDLHGKDIQISASFGVADTDDVFSSEELLKKADKALYKAKRKGKNRVEKANADISKKAS